MSPGFVPHGRTIALESHSVKSSARPRRTMSKAEKPVRMHPYVLVPLAATLVGAAIASANLARAPSHEASRYSSVLIGLSALWGLFDFMAVTRGDADAALFWLRALVPVALLLGPVCALLLAVLKPCVARVMRGLAWAGFALAVPSVHVALTTPLVIAGAVPSTAAVWRYETGPLFPLFVAQTLALPVLTVLGIAVARRLQPRRDPLAADAQLAMIVMGPGTLAFVTDALLPMWGVDSPRVGAFGLAFLGGLIWLSYFSGFDGAVSEAGLARRILERLPTGVALIESDGRLRAVNAPLARWLGVERDALIGRSISCFLLMPAPELLGLEGERQSELLPEDADPIPVAVSPGRIHDRQGGHVGWVVSFRDLREQAALESHLHAANQMATVGEMAAGIAHEVNNPVAYIQANLNLMRRHYQALAETLESAGADPACTPEFIESGADRVEDALAGLARISTIVREVRAFAHAGQAGRQPTDVNALLESALALAALNRSGSGPLEKTLGELPRVELGGQDLKQAFFGVAQWAFSRVSGSERVEVGTALVEDGVHVVFELRAARGAGLADPVGRTTTGSIQLLIARQIVERQGGEFSAEDFEDGFTRIRIILPVVPGAPGPSEHPRAAALVEAARELPGLDAA